MVDHPEPKSPRFSTEQAEGPINMSPRQLSSAHFGKAAGKNVTTGLSIDLLTGLTDEEKLEVEVATRDYIELLDSLESALLTHVASAQNTKEVVHAILREGRAFENESAQLLAALQKTAKSNGNKIQMEAATRDAIKIARTGRQRLALLLTFHSFEAQLASGNVQPMSSEIL